MPAVDGALSAPDGGYGWVIVFSSFFIHFMCNGLSLAMGVLCVPWYQEFNSTKTETSWIVSVMVAVMLAMGPFASSLANRIGYRAMAMVGACFLTVGCLLSCIADSILTLMLTLGVIGGIGAGMCYLPAVAVPAFYFEKRRSVAMGLGTAGIGAGMFLLAPIINFLIEYYGWRGTMVIVAGLFLNLCVAGALMRPLDVVRPTRGQMTAIGRYPNSETTSETESLVQSIDGNDPMLELKMKLGRINLDSNSDSVSGEGSLSTSKVSAGSSHSDSYDGSHRMGSNPVFAAAPETPTVDIVEGSPKASPIKIDPFPAIDIPKFGSDKGSRNNSEEEYIDNPPNGSQSIASDISNAQAELASKQFVHQEGNRKQKHSDNSSAMELINSLPYPPAENLVYTIEREQTLAKANKSYRAADRNQPSAVNRKSSEFSPELPFCENNQEISHPFQAGVDADSHNTLHSDAQQSRIQKHTFNESDTHQRDRLDISRQCKHKATVNKKDFAMFDKAKHLEQLISSTSDSAPSLVNTQTQLKCDHLQESPILSHSYIATAQAPHSGAQLISGNPPPPPPQVSPLKHVFEPSGLHRSLPGNPPHSNQLTPQPTATNIFRSHSYDEDHNNNNNDSLVYTKNDNGHNNTRLANRQSSGYLAPNPPANYELNPVFQISAANQMADKSNSLHSMASLGLKPTLAPNIFLNDMPMGGSLTVLESEASLPLTAHHDVQACKQFRSLLGLDTGLAQQRQVHRSSNSFVNPRDVRAAGSIFTLMTLDRSLSQSKRVLSKGSHDYFRSRQTLYGSKRDSFRSKNGSFIRGKGTSRRPVTLTARLLNAIMGQLRLLNDTTFLLFALSNFFTNLSIVMPSVFMVDRAVSMGLGKDFAALLVSLNGAGTIGGRVAIAVGADHPRVNRMVAYVTVLILAGAVTCFSPFCGTSMVLHGIYACGFGLLIGNYGALCPCVMVDLKGLDSVGESYGMLLLFMGVSNLLSAPIGGVLYDLSGNFGPPFILHGLFLVGSGLIMLPLLLKK